MLVMPSDSGYNSPCIGVEPSSSFESPCLSKPSFPTSGNIIRVNRKLCFASSSPSPESDCDSESAQYLPATRSKEIARRLLHLCDSFDKEFVIDLEYSKTSSWTSAFIRSLGL
ncbi:hypothetical protein Aduo_015892 [Ancylostoma duodenale]